MNGERMRVQTREQSEKYMHGKRYVNTKRTIYTEDFESYSYIVFRQ